MKTFTLTHKARVMEVKAYEGTVYGKQTIKGVIEWVQNNYDQSVTFFVASNSERKWIEITSHSKVSKAMKAFLVAELTNQFITEEEN